ncbi:hypothetical protein V6N12_076156 [Hibiscus sabdariffa]|uniref:Protein kinase domain-containing protein n=1 Tax=Hibiscus sabdariffa TaxID=183260 RepID=A0ABR2AVI4_9ROSI
MGGDRRRPSLIPPRKYISPHSLLFLSLYLLTSNLAQALLALAPSSSSSSSSSPSPSPSASVEPPDSFLIDCGSSSETKLDDGRTFMSDSQSSTYLSTKQDILASVDSIPTTAFPDSTFSSMEDLYKTARVFNDLSTYTFPISKPAKHWVRLYFYPLPLPHPHCDLKTAVFTVHTHKFVLLHDFSVTDDSKVVFKEYLVNATQHFSLVFLPRKGSCAFVNAVEIAAVPDEVLSDSASTVPQGGTVNGLSDGALEVSYRLNVGGPKLTPKTDTLARTWLPDEPYNVFPQGAQAVSVSYIRNQPDGKISRFIAPDLVYETAQMMTPEAYAQTMEPNFNLTWTVKVDGGYSYLIRMHFCDIVSKSPDELSFNVYINSLMAVSSLDLTAVAGGLATPYYTDFVLNASAVRNNSIVVQVGPSSNEGLPNAILNGLEIMKLSNIADSLDGLYAVDGSYKGKSMTLKVVAILGLCMAFLAMFFLGIVCIRWRKRPHDWRKQRSFSSWLLPIHGSHSNFLSISGKSSFFGSRKSKSGHSSFYSSQGLGRFFTLNELRNATNNFDEKTVVGVGGFGKVFLGSLEDGTKVAIKRGNQGSEQGIDEFNTEIQMLSKLRHRHLVSLIGFCDEESEMILVYEYMANGPLRDHLYGSDDKLTLSWKQRLDICIGAARGLHYLHTGAAQGIIHRDVKTTNILLDDNFVAKVSDFGLSKTAPMEQDYVSTAVKGSFGYLDSEYFRRQQLTDKSDVYSFGVVLFEVLSARAVIYPGLPRDQVSLAEWAMRWHRKGMIEKIVDPKIAGSINEESLKKFAEAAEKCLAEYGADRPSMGDVLWNLEYALQLQEDSSSKNEQVLGRRQSLNAEAIADLLSGVDDDDSEVNVASQLNFPNVGNIRAR